MGKRKVVKCNTRNVLLTRKRSSTPPASASSLQLQPPFLKIHFSSLVPTGTKRLQVSTEQTLSPNRGDNRDGIQSPTRTHPPTRLTQSNQYSGSTRTHPEQHGTLQLIRHSLLVSCPSLSELKQLGLNWFSPLSTEAGNRSKQL